MTAAEMRTAAAAKTRDWFDAVWGNGTDRMAIADVREMMEGLAQAIEAIPDTET